MPRKKKESLFTVNQDVIKTGVITDSFDILLRFTKDSPTLELFVDELTELVISGLLDKYGRIVVKVNWFADGLTVIAPDTQDAPQGQQESRTEAIDTNPSPNTKEEK